MADATDYSENQFADMFFNNTAPDGALDGPSVALWTTAPANAPTFSNEVDNANEYARVTTSASDWTEAQAGGPVEYQNANDIDFGVLNSGSSTTVEGVVLVREDLGSDQAIYANDDVSVTVEAGNEFKINANDASFKID